ncbi:MAG: 3TM-type holin [Planctomycetota bacterium]
MSFLTAIPIVGKVLEGVIGLIDQAVTDKDEANKLKAQMIGVFQNADLTKFTSLLRAQAGIIMAEATGASWLQRNWRPLLMLIFMVIITNNYIFFPYASLFTDKVTVLELPDFMWQILKIGVGGYIVGRSGEKIVNMWKGKEVE